MKQSSITCVLISAFLLLLLLCGQASLTKATQTWSIQTVDSTGTVEASTSLALDSGGNPHISYSDYANWGLEYAVWNGSAWSIQTVDSNGTCYFTSLALDSRGNPHISYSDDAPGNLKYASWNGSAWNIQTVDSTGTVGADNSLALDSGGNPHISYSDQTNGGLEYATWNGSAWGIQTIDSTIFVGAYNSLALDSAGNPHISYEANGDLKYAALVSPQTSTSPSTPTPTPLGDFWITVSAGPGGTIDGPSGFTSPGTSPYTYTITPAFGYEIVDVTVDGVSQGKISTYTLTEEGNHEISATFTPTQTLTIIAVGIVVAVVVLVGVLFGVSRVRKQSKPSFAKDSTSLSPPPPPT
jgi:hypothetical protein